MTLLNFPPTNGQPTDGSFTYVANGVIYAWDGEKWTANTEQSFEDTYVNIDGDTMTGDLTVPSLNGGPLAGFRNQIINGNFLIWQRGTNGGGSGYQTADRWRLSSNNPNLQRVYPADSIGLPSGAAGRLSGSVGGAGIRQAIELPISGRRAPYIEGSEWTLSFYSSGNHDLNDVAMRFADNNDLAANTVEFTKGTLDVIENLSSGWKRYSTTFTAPTAFNGSNTCVSVTVGGPADGSAIDLTGIQVEPGPVATPFEHRPISTELALCQRYCQVIRNVRYSFFTELQADHYYQLAFNTAMRVNPGVATATAPTVSPGGTASVNASSTYGITVQVATPTTGPNLYQVRGWDLIADAEL